MRKIAFILSFLFCILLVQTHSAKAQDRVDIATVKHITQPFIDAIAGKNIEVRVTYQAGTHYRKDWGEGTFVRLTGKCFAWTDAYGAAWLDCFVLDPPMSLEGFRPPMTLNTAPMDADGNIVVGDPGYWIRYRIWQTRPMVRFSVDDLFAHNKALGAAWNYWVDGREDMHKYVPQWREFGFNDDGTVPGVYLSQPYEEPVDFGEVDWSYRETNNLPGWIGISAPILMLAILLAVVYRRREYA